MIHGQKAILAVKFFMMESKKRIRMMFWIIVLSGSALLGGFTQALDMDDSHKNILLIVWLVSIAVVSIAIDLLWYRAFNQQLKALRPILLEERDPDRYIQEISALLEGKKSPHLRGVLLINLSAAYCEKQEYDTAKALLLQIDPKKLSSVNRLIYWAVLAYVQFYLREDKQACTILNQHEKAFAKFAESPQLGGILAILDIFKKLYADDKAGAKARLEIARPKWENAHNKPDFDYLSRQC